jgi:hypothetical protein
VPAAPALNAPPLLSEAVERTSQMRDVEAGIAYD